MEIKILGMGCPKCKVLYSDASSACRELKLDAKITKVEEISEISNYGVMSTPALVINEKVVAVGKIKYKQVLELIKNA